MRCNGRDRADLRWALALFAGALVLLLVVFVGTTALAMNDTTRELGGALGEAVLGSVGAYRIEGPSIRLFERIEGDYFSILGLPLLPLDGAAPSARAVSPSVVVR